MKVIEARARISAEDATGAVFDKISKKLDNLAKSGKAAKTIDDVSKSMARVQTQMSAIDKFSNSRNAFDFAQKRLRAAQAAAEAHKAAVATMASPNRVAVEAEHRRLSRAIDLATKAYDQQKESVFANRSALMKAGVPIKDVGPNLNPQRLLTSQAVASATVASANATHVAPLDATISAGPAQNSCVLSNELGSNDLAEGRTPAQLLADLQAYTTARRAAGWQKFILFTVLPRDPAGTSITEAAFNTARATHKANLRAGVGVWFDALVDHAANATIGVDGAWSNATNFPDRTHPSPSIHQTIIEPLFRAAVNSLQ